MYIIQRMLLALLACLYSTMLLAESHVEIKISGIEQHLENNVRLFLSIEQQKEHVLITEGRLRRLHKKAPQEIARALQAFGYYRPDIKTELIQITPDKWQASYIIDAGPPLLISEFKLSLTEPMGEDPEFQTLLQNLPLHKDDIFDHVQYETIKTSLAKLASERGYFDARFTEHRVEIDLDNYEARVHLQYDGGSRYSFGEVTLQQNILNDSLLRRYLTFDTGSPYLLNQLIDLQQALNDSDYFRTVEVSPGQPQSENTEVPVMVALSPRKPHRFSFGLGYGSDTGARTKFAWQMPRLNPAGHRFDTETKVSQLGYSIGAYYRVPVLNPRTDQMVYSTGVVNETTDTSESTLRTIGASLKRKRGEWRESIALNYQQEDFIVADQRGDSTLLIPGINWSRTWGNNFIDTFDGLRFDISLRGASENLVSDTGFSQLHGSIKAINSLDAHNRFITRGSLGSTWTQEFEQLPSSVRFFAGGAQSVRGYAYQSLGPLDENNEVIGGKHLMIGSIEFEHSFTGKWGLALFYDAGNAIDDFSEKLERGAGFGFRWKSPIGPVRIDLASAISQDDKPWRLHINIGPDL
ncbi:MAG: autotransporter assembly complex protein TamA [Gammaproteobacteria bacterium]|nr:autotransporter assembly complex protein TamA [Gammaproteobacteria bacterium]